MSMTTHYIHQPSMGQGPSYPYQCGARSDAGSTFRGDITCSECLRLMSLGSGLHTPPRMNATDDGIFLFTDRHHGDGFTMEVVPQLSGNVEITIEEPGGSGHMFTLSHLDRADMLRALLHEFHYSPERGGPYGIDS